MPCLRHWTASLSVAAALFVPTGFSKIPVPSAPRVQAIRFWSFGNITRIAVQTDGEYHLKSDQIDTPPRLYFDLTGAKLSGPMKRNVQIIQVGDQRVKQIRVAQISSTTTRIVFDLDQTVEVVSSQLVNPDRLMIELKPKRASGGALSTAHSFTGTRRLQASQGESITEETPPTRSPDRPPLPKAVAKTVAPSSMSPAPVAVSPSALPSSATIAEADRSFVRVLGLKLGRVVIDAGHGGHDTGTIGPNGLLEKDLVLDVALRLGRLIKTRLGAEIVYTRSSDVFVPLEERTKIANDQKADLFISIHANSSPQPAATGVETYYFNFTSDRTGLDLATRENATSSSSISDLNDLLHRAVLKTKLEESREFAQRVQTSLSLMSVKMNGKSRDRGVRKAPFVVLIGATMPSILAEVGFVSNPHDEKLMKRIDQRQRIAEALYKGVSGYASSLSHVQLARVGAR